MAAGDAIGLWGVPIAVLGGGVRVSTPFLFVSLGECITERSGRINLGLEGTLVMGAMCAYATSYLTGSPWLGVLAAGAAGAAAGAACAASCGPAAGDPIRLGRALLLFRTRLAGVFCPPPIQPAPPALLALPTG